MIRFAVPLALFALLVPLAVLLAFRARWRDLALPALAAACIVLAVAGPEIRTERREARAFILVDRSLSVTASAGHDALDEAVTAVRAANPGVQFGTIDFAARAVVTCPLSLDPAAQARVPADSLGLRTNLAAAVTLALGVLPEGGDNRLVLVSDGRVTDGLLDAVSAARAADTPISVVSVGRETVTDAALDSFAVPAEVEVGRPFQLTASVACAAPSDAVLTLYRDGELVATSQVRLDGGLSRFRMRDTLSVPGAHSYRAAVKRDGDPFPQNDALSAFTLAGAGARLLVVSQTPSPALAAALEATGVPAAVRSSVPSIEELVDVRQILLAGIPLGSLGSRDLGTLRAFVSELGGGLLVAQGEDDLRGVRGGGLEDLLPVTYTLPQRADQASLAVVYLLDRSASMLGSASGALKIDVVREAAAASIGLVEPDATVGVIAFDRDFRWLAPLAPIGDGRSVYESLRTLEASGGTDIYYPLLAALDGLSRVAARVKHILILSDGKTVDEPRDWTDLYARLAAQPDVHVSAIAIGPQPNLPLFDELADASRGTVYTAADISELPQVSMQATQRLSRSRFAVGDVTVTGPLVEGDLAGVPALQGYAVTYPRPTAETLLWSGSDPIFARWRLGLGWVGALNVDLEGRWTRDWLAWGRAPLLVETLLGRVEPETWVTRGLEPRVEVLDTGVRLAVDARAPDGSFDDFLDLQATILPGGQTVALGQTSPGFYESVEISLPEGAYAVRMDDRTRQRVATLPFAVPYSPEVRSTGPDAAALREVARATGGSVLAGDLSLGTSDAGESTSYAPVERQVLLAGLGLFLLELARRKVPRRRDRSA